MASTKISDLTALAGADSATGDVIPIVDTDAAETKKITVAELASAISLSTPGKNALINGNFDVWQRGTAFTADGYTADRWQMTEGASNAITVSQSAFGVGDTSPPGNPTWFMRFNRTSTASAPSHMYQKVEGVRTFSGETVTLSFWARVDSAAEVDTFFRQDFGTGGSPSGDVDSTPEANSITTSWAKYTNTVALASISGKTIGDNGDDYLRVDFQLHNDQGDVQLDIAQVQLELGPTATEFQRRSFGEELVLCQRYYQTVDGGDCVGGGTGATQILFGVQYPVQMRATATIVLEDATPTFIDHTGTSFTGTASTIAGSSIGANSARLLVGGFTSITAGDVYVGEQANTLLSIAAEL